MVVPSGSLYRGRALTGLPPPFWVTNCSVGCVGCVGASRFACVRPKVNASAVSTLVMSVFTARSATSRAASRADFETARVRSKNVNGVGVAAALNPTGGYRDELARKGIKPKDHFRENIVEMRRKQKEAQALKEEEEAAEKAEKFKLKRFSAVESRVAQVRVLTLGAAALVECRWAMQLSHSSLLLIVLVLVRRAVAVGAVERQP